MGAIPMPAHREMPGQMRRQARYFLARRALVPRHAPDMPRFSRFVQPGVPYHVTHCGNRQQDLFMGEAGRAAYRELLRDYYAKAGPAIWAYCWMPNHVHLRKATSTGRPCGEQGWVKDLERQAGRPLAPRPAGRKLLAQDVAGQGDLLTDTAKGEE